MQQKQTAAATIVARQADIQQCTVVLRESIMAKYTQYPDLKGDNMQLVQSNFDIDVHVKVLSTASALAWSTKEQTLLCMLTWDTSP